MQKNKNASLSHASNSNFEILFMQLQASSCIFYYQKPAFYVGQIKENMNAQDYLCYIFVQSNVLPLKNTHLLVKR